MITINSYVVAERAVYEAVALAVERMSTDKELANKPEQIVDFLAQSIMTELTGIFDFGHQLVNLTKDLQARMWLMAQAEAKKEVK